MGRTRRITLVSVVLVSIAALGLLTTVAAPDDPLTPRSYLPVIWIPAGTPAATETPPPSPTPRLPEIRFTGTALDRFDAPCCDQLSWWRVQVEAVQAGPERCSGEVVKVLFGAGFLPRLGRVDPSIQPGDRVEVYGYYVQSGEGCTADLMESRHFIRQAGHLRIDPPRPRATDAISLTVTGLWGSSCPAVIHSFGQVRGNVIQVVAGVTEAEAACNTVVTSWRFTERLGPLAAGRYIVLADVVDLAGGSFGLHDRLEFQVAP